MNAHTENSRFAAEQARTIRKALAAGRSLLSWSVSLADGSTRVVFASTDRAAHATAATAGAVLRVGPAVVRDLQTALERALLAAPPVAPRTPKAPKPVRTPEQRESDRAFEREWRELLEQEERDQARVRAARDASAYWATGEGPRPEPLSTRTERRVAGTPRHQITARPRPGVGAPFVGEATLVGTGRGARLAHEFTPARASAPEWRPSFPAASY